MVEGSGAREVGRGRPPVASRFQKGTSGNPAGRPRKPRDIRKLIDAELDQVIAITENGRRLRLTKREIMIKKLVNDAVTGDDKALKALLAIIGTSPEPDPVVAVDPAELARFAMRYLPDPAASESRSGSHGVKAIEDDEP